MIRRILLLMFLFGALKISAQNYDSLFTEFMDLKENQNSIVSTKSDSKPIKCAFGIHAEIKHNFDRFSTAQKNQLAKVLGRPSPSELPLTLDSPMGLFKLHYDTTNVFDKPGYDLNELAEAFDSSYNFQINVMGFDPPPSDNGLGGDNKIDVYIWHLGGDVYGFTEFDDSNNPNQFSAYIQMDNDYPAKSYYTSGINAAKVTAAHELHHVIQVGSYAYKSDDIFYHELTSTAMEEFVFDEVNDYYAYMGSYFRETRFPLTLSDGYESAVWNIFINEKLNKEFHGQKKGFEFIKRTWEILRGDYRAIEAIALSFTEFGLTFSNEFSDFGAWMYFTGARADTENYFSEGVAYPSISLSMDDEFIPPASAALALSTRAITLNYLQFTNIAEDPLDVIICVISNSDIVESIERPLGLLDVSYTLSQSDNNYFSKVTSSKKQFISEANIINNIQVTPFSSGSSDIGKIVFPQPFNYQKHINLIIPLENSDNSEVELIVFTPSMDVVYKNFHEVFGGTNPFIRWDAKKVNGEYLPSGVYIYSTKYDNSETIGKFVIFND
ncbi:MAG: hypothetical protein K9J12_12700 [Melioribacteraceae bacterium]|nr:hypothetical protein [Melioribacteraceae bacterium]MCF8265353.1 hypothetical protein [Melioribacteraceae bacterium]MCF8430495.1 hypothetical protein [Melioribacteraceae bacterium]